MSNTIASLIKKGPSLSSSATPSSCKAMQGAMNRRNPFFSNNQGRVNRFFLGDPKKQLLITKCGVPAHLVYCMGKHLIQTR
jgi:hypothetical protein